MRGRGGVIVNRKGKFRTLFKLLFGLIAVVFLAACGDETESESSANNSGYDFVAGQESDIELTIVAGSENEILEPMLTQYAEEQDIGIGVDYLGSLDIMRQLQAGEVEYDAVWPASTIWLTVGDEHSLLKHAQSTSLTPIIFGVKQSLAEELGFTEGDVYTADIIEAINNGDLKFAMTSATQSNSGASAYLGFLTALAGSDGTLTEETLNVDQVQQAITELLSGVERSSGSSNWLVDLFVQGDYDAMVNYETLIIQANQQLADQGKEELYAVYPVDGLSMADSPLAYVDDESDPELEETFLAFQEFLLSDETQDFIEQTGRRSAMGNVRDSNRNVFDESLGFDLDTVINPIRFPSANVIQQSLNLYQTQFKKPALTVYVLDYSGSMAGEGVREMQAALEQVLVPENAEQHLLLGTSQDKTHIVPFEDDVQDILDASGNGEEMNTLYEEVMDIRSGGGTAMYEGIDAALTLLDEEYGEDLANYTPAIVILTDGRPNGSMRYSEVEEHYQDMNRDIPIFSILFADSDEDRMEELAGLTNARVFDGRGDLINAFKQVKGYN